MTYVNNKRLKSAHLQGMKSFMNNLCVQYVALGSIYKQIVLYVSLQTYYMCVHDVLPYHKA